MVDAIYGASQRARNDSSVSLSSDSVRRRCREPDVPLHPEIIVHPLVTPDDQVALLRAAEEEVVISIDDLARAIPSHPRPISAILVLVDAGLLGMDTGSSFDASIQLWRTAPEPR